MSLTYKVRWEFKSDHVGLQKSEEKECDNEVVASKWLYRKCKKQYSS